MGQAEATSIAGGTGPAFGVALASLTPTIAVTVAPLRGGLRSAGVKMFGKDPWVQALAVIRPALVIGDLDLTARLQLGFQQNGITSAVAAHGTPALFNWLLSMSQLQGISDANATGFTAKHGPVRWSDIETMLAGGAACSRLSSYWHFADCGYRKEAKTCAAPSLLTRCPLPTHPLRNGRLSQGAHSLFLFLRDVCDGDLVEWIDQRLKTSDEAGSPERSERMRDALIGPLSQVFGVSRKVLSMALADLLLGGDPDRERWVTTGAAMIAIDTLVHNFLARTGVLRRFDAEHAYGPGCYAEHGCAAIIEGIAHRVDARAFNPTYPAVFPRFIQQSIWRFCAVDERNICNGRQIDDRHRCRDRWCPAGPVCSRLALSPGS